MSLRQELARLHEERRLLRCLKILKFDLIQESTPACKCKTFDVRVPLHPWFRQAPFEMTYDARGCKFCVPDLGRAAKKFSAELQPFLSRPSLIIALWSSP
jgi:hypothetical protein